METADCREVKVSRVLFVALLDFGLAGKLRSLNVVKGTSIALAKAPEFPGRGSRKSARHSGAQNESLIGVTLVPNSGRSIDNNYPARRSERQGSKLPSILTAIANSILNVKGNIMRRTYDEHFMRGDCCTGAHVFNGSESTACVSSRTAQAVFNSMVLAVHYTWGDSPECI